MDELKRIVARLNRALELDPQAVKEIIRYTVPVNAALRETKFGTPEDLGRMSLFGLCFGAPDGGNTVAWVSPSTKTRDESVDLIEEFVETSLPPLSSTELHGEA